MLSTSDNLLNLLAGVTALAIFLFQFLYISISNPSEAEYSKEALSINLHQRYTHSIHTTIFTG